MEAAGSANNRADRGLTRDLIDQKEAEDPAGAKALR
jgi:hypothetical protein